MEYIENKADTALDVLLRRLVNKRNTLNNRGVLSNKPSARGYYDGLTDAILEIQELQLSASKDCTRFANVRLQTMESSTDIGNGVILECWFIRDGLNIIRSDLYKLDDGSVVAFRDTINGTAGQLHMDMAFKAFNAEENCMETILRDSGMYDLSKVRVFYTGR